MAAVTRTFEGLRDLEGWKFTLTPCTAGEFGDEGYPSDSAGYRLHHLEPATIVKSLASFEWPRPDGWREELWLTEWLRQRMILEVTP